VSFIDQPSSNIEDHQPITRLLEDNRTANGGWQKWAIGCICGFYDKGSERLYIPSETSALRIYKEHLTRCGIETIVEEEDDEPTLDRPNYDLIGVFV